MNASLRTSLITGIVGAATFNIVTAYYLSGPGPHTGTQAVFVTDSTLVIVAYLFVGLVAWQVHPAQRIGLLFTIVGYAFLLPAIANIDHPLPFTIGNLLASMYGAGLAHLALAWPYGRLRSRWDRAAVAANYAWNLGNTALSLLFWNTQTQDCGCPKNLLFSDGSARIKNDVNLFTTIGGVFMTVIVIGLVARHWWTARGYVRVAMTRLVLVASPIGAYIAATDIYSGAGSQFENLLVYGYGRLIFLAAPAAYAVELRRARHARAEVGVALVDLEPGPAPGRLLDALARALGDPTLQLAVRTTAGPGYVDTAGAPIDVSDPGRFVIALDPAGDDLLIADDNLRHEPELIRVAAAAAAMALQHARLRAEIQVQLEQVRDSRARIVQAGDAARSRLERDLHDGAQQRLVTLSLALGMARNRAAGADPELESLLESATKEAKEALVELRELARGIHPAILTESGLAGAIQSLVERSPVAAMISEVPDRRFVSPIEATAYFVISEALANVAKHAPTANVQIRVREVIGRLIIDVTDDGPGGADPNHGTGLRGLADRVASVGGTIQVLSTPSGTRLTAELPHT